MKANCLGAEDHQVAGELASTRLEEVDANSPAIAGVAARGVWPQHEPLRGPRGLPRLCLPTARSPRVVCGDRTRMAAQREFEGLSSAERIAGDMRAFDSPCAKVFGELLDLGGPPQIPLNLVGDFGGGSLYLVAGVVSAHTSRRARPGAHVR